MSETFEYWHLSVRTTVVGHYVKRRLPPAVRRVFMQNINSPWRGSRGRGGMFKNCKCSHFVRRKCPRGWRKARKPCQSSRWLQASILRHDMGTLGCKVSIHQVMLFALCHEALSLQESRQESNVVVTEASSRCGVKEKACTSPGLRRRKVRLVAERGRSTRHGALSNRRHFGRLYRKTIYR